MRYDYLIVGAGLFGSIFAYEAHKAGKKVLVVDRRGHVGGNIYTKETEGIQVHQYGAHIFHTSDQEVWDYVPDEATAYRYAPEVAADSASVVQVVTGQSRLDKDFSVESLPDENGLAVLRLYPREPSAQMVEATLWADKASGLIRRVRVLDFYGNANDMTFTRLTPDAPAPESAFRFTPPRGVTVEDLQDQSAPERPLLR